MFSAARGPPVEHKSDPPPYSCHQPIGPPLAFLYPPVHVSTDPPVESKDPPKSDQLADRCNHPTTLTSIVGLVRPPNNKDSTAPVPLDKGSHDQHIMLASVPCIAAIAPSLELWTASQYSPSSTACDVPPLAGEGMALVRPGAFGNLIPVRTRMGVLNRLTQLLEQVSCLRANVFCVFEKACVSHTQASQGAVGKGP